MFKDLDLDSCFKMTDSGRIALLKQLSADCAFLEGAHVMDYSLLLGVHFRNKAEVASPEPGDAAGREAHTETAHADAAESDVELHPAIGDQGEHASSAVRKPAGSADAGVTSAALTSSIGECLAMLSSTATDGVTSFKPPLLLYISTLQ